MLNNMEVQFKRFTEVLILMLKGYFKHFKNVPVIIRKINYSVCNEFSFHFLFFFLIKYTKLTKLKKL